MVPPKAGSEIFAEAQLATLGRASGDARDKVCQDPLYLYFDSDEKNP